LHEACLCGSCRNINELQHRFACYNVQALNVPTSRPVWERNDRRNRQGPADRAELAGVDRWCVRLMEVEPPTRLRFRRSRLLRPAGSGRGSNSLGGLPSDQRRRPTMVTSTPRDDPFVDRMTRVPLGQAPRSVARPAEGGAGCVARSAQAKAKPNRDVTERIERVYALVNADEYGAREALHDVCATFLV
jgi:hypothetical protein